MVHWPEHIVVRIIQRGCPCDHLLGEVSLAVPGYRGRPAVDPVPQVRLWEGKLKSAFKPLWKRSGE